MPPGFFVCFFFFDQLSKPLVAAVCTLYQHTCSSTGLQTLRDGRLGTSNSAWFLRAMVMSSILSKYYHHLKTLKVSLLQQEALHQFHVKQNKIRCDY